MGFVLTQAVRAVYGEAHEDYISVWIGERSQPVIVLLTCSVPQSQLHLTRFRAKDNRMWRKGEREEEEKKMEEVKLIHHVHPDQQNFHAEVSK